MIGGLGGNRIRKFARYDKTIGPPIRVPDGDYESRVFSRPFNRRDMVVVGSTGDDVRKQCEHDRENKGHGNHTEALPNSVGWMTAVTR